MNNLDINEIKLFNLLKKNLNDKGTFIEIGARDGKDHCHYLAKNGWNGYCIEANPEIFVNLKKTYRNNKNIKTYNYAISSKNKIVDFYIENTINSGVSSLYKSRANGNDAKLNRIISKKITIEAKTLNTFIEENNIKDCDLLITDCEGEDFNILLSTDFSKLNIKFIFSEVGTLFHCDKNWNFNNRREISLNYLEKLIKHMKKYNYDIYLSNEMSNYMRKYYPDLIGIPNNIIFKKIYNINFEKHNACVFTEYGWVDIDENNFKSINCVKLKLHDDILQSAFYKNKEDIYWPKVKKINNYESKHGKCISYYDTEYINYIIRYPEFTPEQFKESLIFLCNVCKYCKNHGYYLRTHLWNLTYYKGYPFLIDIRDFEKLNKQNWLCIFKGHFREKIDKHCPIKASNFIKNYSYIYKKLNKCRNNLDDIKSILNEIKPINSSNGDWTNYHKNRTNFLLKSENLNDIQDQIENFKGGCGKIQKSSNLFKIIKEINPKNIIELGCNNGLYTFGFTKYCPSIGIDYDINSINLANKINKNLKVNTKFIYFNILDETKLEKNYGYNGCYGNIYSRFKSDMVVAPAIIHHLNNQCKSTDKIIKIFDKFAIKYILIEQIPSMVNKKNLVNSLLKYKWKIIKTITSSPKPREWLLCTRNN